MTKQQTAELVKGKRLRVITAHPDDSLWYTKLVAESEYADEALLTAGTRGKDVRIEAGVGSRVKDGWRLREEKAAARILGFRQVLLYEGLDGELKEYIDSLVPQVAQEAERDSIDIFAASTFTDHPDHLAATDIAIRAAQTAAQAGYPIGVLLIRPDLEGDYCSEATPQSMAQTFRAARKHETQWRMAEGPHDDWPMVPGGLSMHPDDLASLELYPFLRDATYTWLSPHQIAHMDDGGIDW